jgi:hypothetical protein
VHPFRLLARAIRYASANRELAATLAWRAFRAGKPRSSRHV